ncbi:MAG: ATP-binding protein [Solirubrobacterales bacterium]
MNLYSLLTFLACVLYLYFGYYVLYLDRRSRVNQVFSACCLAFAWWAFCVTFYYPAPSEAAAKFWQSLATLGFATVPSLFLLFCLLLTGTPYVRRFWFLLFIPSALFAYQSLFGSGWAESHYTLTSFGWYGTPNLASPWYIGFIIYYPVCVLASGVVLWRWRAKNTSPRRRKQVETIVYGAGITIFLSLVNETVLPSMGYLVPQIPAFFGLVWAFGIWTAITRYRLMVVNTGLASTAIISHIRDLIILTDPTGNVTAINPRVTEVLEWSETDLVGRPVGDVIVETDWVQNLLHPQSVQDEVSRELTYVGANGHTIPVQASISPVLDSTGDYIGRVLIAQDIRETRQLEHEIQVRETAQQALQLANEKLKELDRIKTDFLATVSHELRTPLTSILGFSKIISRQTALRVQPMIDPENKKAAAAVRQIVDNSRIIVSESERLTSLISDVLDIAKMESGKVEWKNHRFSLYDLLDRAVEATAGLFAGDEVVLIKETEPDLPEIYGDFDRLLQVVINLISNACKFTEYGSVTCRMRRLDDHVAISVSDTGIGIDPADQARVFDKFKQVGDPLTNKPKGTGLGLPICKQIVEHHSGRIWLESAPNTGSTFTFTLPLSSDSHKLHLDLAKIMRQLPTLPIRPRFSETGEPKTILVADDDRSIRLLLKQELDAAGYRVTEASNGLEALTIIHQQRPDLVILDVMMPDVSGFDVASVLKSEAETSNLPIILLSIVEDLDRGYRLGVDRYLTKPVDIETLLGEIRRILDDGGIRRALIVDEGLNDPDQLGAMLVRRGFTSFHCAEAAGVLRQALTIVPEMIIVEAALADRENLADRILAEPSLENTLLFPLHEEADQLIASTEILLRSSSGVEKLI